MHINLSEISGTQQKMSKESCQAFIKKSIRIVQQRKMVLISQKYQDEVNSVEFIMKFNSFLNSYPHKNKINHLEINQTQCPLIIHSILETSFFNFRFLTQINLYKLTVPEQSFNLLIKAGLKFIRQLCLEELHISEEAIKKVTKCQWKYLKRFSINNCHSSNKILGYLAKSRWKNIEYLIIVENKINSDGLKVIQRFSFPKMKEMWLFGTFSNGFLKTISKDRRNRPTKYYFYTFGLQYDDFWNINDLSKSDLTRFRYLLEEIQFYNAYQDKSFLNLNQYFGNINKEIFHLKDVHDIN